MSTIFLDPSQTRLVTIAAHVDHGKTTLADNLVEHNGIISERLAGTLRYLDSDPEEQRRGITMRSSAIGLSHEYTAPPGKANHNNSNDDEPGPRIIHLVDSPGHTDFSWEVSSALAACDACLLVVDVVEGMGPRTHQVFREALIHQLVPVLVMNKIDRLCTNLCLTPTEAYIRTRSLLESVNAAAAAMITSLHQQQQENNNNGTNDNSHVENDIRAKEEILWTFDPAKGNVVFCSALFGWGFTAASLARSLFRHKLVTIKPLLLRQYMFGDFKVKGDKVLKWKASSDEAPLFAEYGLQPIWDCYQGVAMAASAVGQGSTLFADGRGGGGGNNNHNHNNKMSRNSNAKIKAHTPGMDLVAKAIQIGATSDTLLGNDLDAILTKTGANTEESVLRSLLRRFRPLASTLLDTVCEYCPSPRESSLSGRSRLLSLQEPPSDMANPNRASFHQMQVHVRNCDTSIDAPSVAFVCKFFSSERAHIRDPSLPDVNSKDTPKNLILGLARVLSGRLRSDHEYYVLGPKYNPQKHDEPPKKAIKLYLLMGSSFLRVEHVPAGHLCAVLGLEDVHLKNITLFDRLEGAMPLKVAEKRVRPLVKVNIEPEDSADSDELDRGLVKLSLADAAVEVTVTARGERILACLGELHLEQSLLDLKRIYCSREIGLRTSDPIVDFGETTDWFTNELAMDYKTFLDDKHTPQPRQSRIPPFNEEEGLAGASLGRARTVLSKRLGAISLRVVPLANAVHKSLKTKRLEEDCQEELFKLGKALGLAFSADEPQTILDTLVSRLCTIFANGNALIESLDMENGVTVFGVQSDSGEVFVPPTESLAAGLEEMAEYDKVESKPIVEASGKNEFDALRLCIRDGVSAALALERRADLDEAALGQWKKMKGSAIAGVQSALRSGPICEEPVRNVLVILEGFELAMTCGGEAGLLVLHQPAQPLSGGMVISALRCGIRCALLTRPARLMEGYLRLTLHSSIAGFGKLHSVLSRRRGIPQDDTMVDGTDLLAVTALIPQAEAFGLAPELLKETSGEVTAPEMIFSHWQRLEVDPFWIPTTEEEREDYGELQVAGDSSTGIDNTAIRYIRKVRERKGLKVDSSRTVVAAEKQRTLKK